jgi:hypothetical protein
MNHKKFAWNDYFSGTSVTTTLGPGQYNSQKSYSSGNIYVLNCLFNSFTSGSSGGALYCSSSVVYLLVESSSFFSCKTSRGDGGAIYFYNTNNGQCVLYGVCGNDCCSTYTSDYPHGQFAYIFASDGASYKNYINYSSIAHCVTTYSYSRCTVFIGYGKIYFPSVNESMNKCQLFSGVYCRPFVDSSSVTCSITYSTFVDNNDLGFNCIYFDRANVNREFKCCNILRNTQSSSSEGLIQVYGNLMIEDSSILENTATNIFYAYSSYAITLSNCTVDRTTSTGSLIIQNTVTKSFILGLNHLSTRNCHSEYDSAGYLTAAPQLSQKTKKLFCYTNNQCHNRIGDFFSFNCLFIVTFIHPNPSVDC